MIGRLSVTFLLLAVPAFGQSRVYTNADLGKVQRTRTVTEEELASLRANQFVYVPPAPRGPQVIRINSSTAEGPYGPFYMLRSEPLDPFFTYGVLDAYGPGYWGHPVRGPVVVSVPNLSFPAPITVPDFARGPISLAPVVPSPSGAGHRGRRR